jgi:hypothetical protein
MGLNISTGSGFIQILIYTTPGLHCTHALGTRKLSYQIVTTLKWSEASPRIGSYVLEDRKKEINEAWGRKRETQSEAITSNYVERGIQMAHTYQCRLGSCKDLIYYTFPTFCYSYLFLFGPVICPLSTLRTFVLSSHVTLIERDSIALWRPCD